jgi:hypothetical protein
MSGVIHPLPNTPSWRAQLKKHRGNFTLIYIYIYIYIWINSWVIDVVERDEKVKNGKYVRI